MKHHRRVSSPERRNSLKRLQQTAALTQHGGTDWSCRDGNLIMSTFQEEEPNDPPAVSRIVLASTLSPKWPAESEKKKEKYHKRGKCRR